MSVHLKVIEDGEPFAFSEENRAEVERILSKYPPERKRSAILPLLHLAQKQNGGWVSRQVVEHVAELLEIPKIQALEVATFYTMFNLKPIGRHHVQVCGTTPCWLRGSDEVFRACRDMGLEKGQIDHDYYEDLDYEKMKAILEALRRGERPKPGPQVDRQFAAPEGGPTTLKDRVPANVTPGGRLKEDA